MDYVLCSLSRSKGKHSVSLNLGLHHFQDMHALDNYKLKSGVFKRMKGFHGVVVAADGVSCAAGVMGGAAISLNPLVPSQHGQLTEYR